MNRKPIFCGVLLVLTFLSLSACAPVKDTSEGPGSEEVVYPRPIGRKSSMEFGEPVTMSLVRDTLSPKGADFLVSNNRGIDIATGTMFWIEIEIEGEWYEIDWAHDVTAEGGVIFRSLTDKPIEAHASRLFSEKWEKIYGKLPPGKYLFIKSYSIPSESPRQAEPQYHYICCPFAIE